MSKHSTTIHDAAVERAGAGELPHDGERPEAGRSAEPGWWIVLKVALFVAIPVLLIYVVKVLVDPK